VDDICIIEACTQAINHDRRFLFQTNQQPGRPSMGSWLSYGLGVRIKICQLSVLLSRGVGIFSRLLPAMEQWLSRLDSSGCTSAIQERTLYYISESSGTDKQSRGKMLEHVASLNRFQERSLVILKLQHECAV
jgi:hypothetical protein